MWCLKGSNGTCIYVTRGNKSFGKILCDVKLEGDPTISRRHAVIYVEPREESDVLGNCLINDCSKYGTFVTRNGEKRKLLVNEKFLLKDNDVIQFGLKQTIFVVSSYAYVTVKSNLNKEDTEGLMDTMRLLGLKLTEKWDSSCTHLTVANDILFTTKVACTLAAAKPIVTIKYWEAVSLAVEQSRALPDIESFLPTLKEEFLKASSRLFLPNEQRRTLFKGLSFVHFCGKQYFTYSSLITAAGGKSCVYPTNRPLTPRDLTAKNAIVVQQPANESSQSTQVIATDYPVIYRKLDAIQRRMISDTEIPLAILYHSTEMYCNPKFKFVALLKSNTQMFSSSDVTMIEDTQDVNKTDNRIRRTRTIIPETCVSQDNTNDTRRDVSDVNRNNVATQNTDQGKIARNIIPETCESQKNDDVSTNKTQDGKIVVNIFSRKRAEIIPESICSSGENASGTISDKSDRRRARNENSKLVSKIFENVDSEPDEIKMVKNIAQRQSIGSQGEKLFQKTDNKSRAKEALVSVTTTEQERENYLIPETNDSRYVTQDDPSRGKDDSLNNSASHQDSKRFESLKRPRIVSIEEIDNRGINIEKIREREQPALDSQRTKSNSSKERKLDLDCMITIDTDKNRESCQERTNENRARERDRKKDARKTDANLYERHANGEVAEKLLRKDAPRGKTFTKMSVVIPKRILRMDDFVKTTM